MADPGQLAATLLQKNFPKFGTFLTSVSYLSYPSATYTPATGLVVLGTPVTRSLNVAFLGFSMTKNQSTNRYRDNDPVQDIDIKVLFPALDLDLTPKIGDVITQGSKSWIVIGVNSDPKPAHWALHCRAQV